MAVLPVVVIGGGPQGLAATAHLLERGQETLVLEAGDEPAAAVRQWAHVRLFSPWSELVDPAAARLLAPTGWEAPAEGYPTGAEWIDLYLAPLAAALGDHVRYGIKVTGVSRRGRDRLISAGRAEQPFTVHADIAGRESRFDARAVIDASGTWTQPSPAGADGLPALGERTAAAGGSLTYLPPTPGEVGSFAGHNVVVVGSGHSALTAVIDLAAMAETDPATRLTWVLRRGVVGHTFGGGSADELPQRGALGVRARQAVDAGLVDLVTGFRTEKVYQTKAGLVLVAEDGRSLPAADHVVVLTGFRPDLSFLSELRLDLDPVLQAPSRLAGEIDPNLHSCGSVSPHGAKELAQPETDLYLVGMKSYGRAPTFLMTTGNEQVRSVVAALAGDLAAADEVHLELPETGVCSVGATGADTGDCCGAGAVPDQAHRPLPEGAVVQGFPTGLPGGGRLAELALADTGGGGCCAG